MADADPLPPALYPPYVEPPEIVEPLPTYCKVIFIADAALCAARALLIPLSVIGYIELRNKGGALLPSVAYEIGTAVGLAAFGIPANILMLIRKSWALLLGCITVFFTFGSILVGVWQVAITIGQAGSGPRMYGTVFGGALSLLFRVAVLVLYLIALTKFSRWAKRQDALT